MNEDEKDPIAIVALDIPPAVVCSDGVCVIADEHPTDAEDGSENSTPAQ